MDKKDKSQLEDIIGAFVSHCDGKRYHSLIEDIEHGKKVTVSNLSDRVIVSIFRKRNKILIQGSDTLLKTELEELKKEIVSNPGNYLVQPQQTVHACSTCYDIILNDIQNNIKDKLLIVDGQVEISEKPETSTSHRIKIDRGEYTITITQFINGTLLLQGKEDNLFDEICDIVEKTANPSDTEVMARFFSNDEASLELVTAKYTPKLIEIAEQNVKDKIGFAYDYLEPYDKKWLVASECLCLTKVVLPEYSPLVMPASKALEGFYKKILIGIGLFPTDHFKTKTANFSNLYDVKNPLRQKVCSKERHVDTFLKQIALNKDKYRNFMMHSDDSKITKVETEQNAIDIVEDIFKEIKELFDYFNDYFNLVEEGSD